MNAPDKIKSPFETLSAINVNEHVEKKNGLSYLSWPFAVSELMKADPSANWVFNEPIQFGETMMVSCTVTAFGKAITMHLPVMDHRNQAIKNPDAFAVNKNMMRCLVKAIACHGLGLYIYAGEDLPEGQKEEEDEDAVEILATLASGEYSKAVKLYVQKMESLDTNGQATFRANFKDSRSAHILAIGSRMWHAETLEQLQTLWTKETRAYAKEFLEDLKDECKAAIINMKEMNNA